MPQGSQLHFGGMPVSGLEGSFNITVLASGRECLADFLIASADITPLIGRDLINVLELSICRSHSSLTVGPMLTESESFCSTLQSISSLSSQVDTQNMYTSLLCEFLTLMCDHPGSYPGFQHCILLNPDTVPVACSLRSVPLALWVGVETTVHELDHQGSGSQ